MTAARSWQLTHRARPPTMNRARNNSFWTQAATAKEWRHTFNVLARAGHLPRLDQVTVIVDHDVHGGRLPDIGACMPAVKAAVDGIVDAHVIPDDDPAHLIGLYLRPPKRATVNALTLTVINGPLRPTDLQAAP